MGLFPRKTLPPASTNAWRVHPAASCCLLFLKRFGTLDLRGSACLAEEFVQGKVFHHV